MEGAGQGPKDQRTAEERKPTVHSDELVIAEDDAGDTPDTSVAADPSPVEDYDPAATHASYRPKGPWRRFHRWMNEDDFSRELSLGVLFSVLVAGLLGSGIWWFSEQREEDRAAQAEALENTRFVRTVALTPDASKLPFTGMNLRGAALPGLEMGCREPDGSPNDNPCAEMSGADLPDANLTGAWLTGAYLQGVDLSGANLTLVDLSDAKLGPDWSEYVTTFPPENELTGVQGILNALLHPEVLFPNMAVLSNARMSDATLRRTDLLGADLRRAVLEDADLLSADLTLALLQNADLTDADLTDADLTDAKLIGANLTDADLTDADLTDADLRGVCWTDATVWPTDFEPPPPNCDAWG